MHLSAVDLNLLVVLRELLETRSVKEASTRLALSRSATSHALGRLRDAFDDELLVRAGKTMVPTTRALHLEPRLKALLDQTEELFVADQPLEPGRLRRSFAVGSNDFFELVVLPPWSAALARQAPGVDLVSRSVRDEIPQALRAGTVELAMGVLPEMPGDILTAPLLSSEFVCVVRPGHPALARRLTARRYAALEHVLVSPRGRGPGVVDHRLAELGLERRVARVVANFIAAPPLVANSDYILTISRHIADRYVDTLGLEQLPPPLDLAGFTVEMAWHRRQDGDPELRWLRDTLAEVGSQLDDPGLEGAVGP